MPQLTATMTPISRLCCRPPGRPCGDDAAGMCQVSVVCALCSGLLTVVGIFVDPWSTVKRSGRGIHTHTPSWVAAKIIFPKYHHGTHPTIQVVWVLSFLSSTGSNKAHSCKSSFTRYCHTIGMPLSPKHCLPLICPQNMLTYNIPLSNTLINHFSKNCKSMEYCIAKNCQLSTAEYFKNAWLFL